MLCSLHVKNFAIIDDISIDFKIGMTVLTGETGAGKSLIIDATHLLLGARLNGKIVRAGATKAIIEGVFEGYNSKVKELLDEYGIDELDDEELIIRRDINELSKSTARINGVIVSLNQLEKIGSNLVDIHTQNDTKKLFDSHNYLDFIDNEKCLEVLSVYQLKRKIYLECLKDYKNFENRANSDQQQIEFLKYQYQELVNAKLNIDEENNLKEELEYLNNFENINQYLNYIKSDFKDNNINDSLYNIMNYLSKLASFDNKYQELANRIENIYYENLDIEETINNELENLDFDDDRFDEINARLQYLNDLKRKYHTDISGLIEIRDKLENEIKINDNYEVYVDDLKIKLEKSYKELVDVSKELSSLRINQAKMLKDEVTKTLKELMLQRVNFEIQFKEFKYLDMLHDEIFKTNGVDNLDFMISFNAGQPLESLSKVASGGEMSRIMLALKVYLIKQLGLSTIIFDEIDSGISRNVAYVVGQKMKQISQDCQVFAITHLPIVASFANQHLFIEKIVTDDDMTSVVVKELSEEERIKELAIMLSPNSTDYEALYTIAKEMIEKNKVIS